MIKVLTKDHKVMKVNIPEAATVAEIILWIAKEVGSDQIATKSDFNEAEGKKENYFFKRALKLLSWTRMLF